MSAEDSRSVRDSNDDEALQFKGVSVHFFRQGSAVNGGNALYTSTSSPTVLASEDFVFAPVTVTDYIDKFIFIFTAKPFAAMYQHGNTFRLFHARLGANCDTGFVAWRKLGQFCGRSGGAMFVE